MDFSFTRSSNSCPWSFTPKVLDWLTSFMVLLNSMILDWVFGFSAIGRLRLMLIRLGIGFVLKELLELMSFDLKPCIKMENCVGSSLLSDTWT